MDIACILLASAAAAFAVLWRLERSWFLAREAGCFCRRKRGGAVQVNPDGCPVHAPKAWRRWCEALPTYRLLPPLEGDPASTLPAGKAKTGRRRRFFSGRRRR